MKANHHWQSGQKNGNFNALQFPDYTTAWPAFQGTLGTSVVQQVQGTSRHTITVNDVYRIPGAAGATPLYPVITGLRDTGKNNYTFNPSGSYSHPTNIRETGANLKHIKITVKETKRPDTWKNIQFGINRLRVRGVYSTDGSTVTQADITPDKITGTSYEWWDPDTYDKSVLVDTALSTVLSNQTKGTYYDTSRIITYYIKAPVDEGFIAIILSNIYISYVWDPVITGVTPGVSSVTNTYQLDAVTEVQDVVKEYYGTSNGVAKDGYKTNRILNSWKFDIKMTDISEADYNAATAT